MVAKLKMPKLGMTMTFGTICKINHAAGDFVKAGEPILEFETNKLSDKVEAPFDGYVKEILVELDDDVECGEPVCVFGDQP